MRHLLSWERPAPMGPAGATGAAGGAAAAAATVLRRGFAWLFAIQAAGLAIAGVPRAEAAVTALVALNQLIVAGDGGDNVITLRCFPLDDREIEVLDGGTRIAVFSRNTFASIVVNAVGGNDTVVLSRIFGPITEPATLNGGPGNDTLSGGAGNDVLNGGTDNDVLVWNAGDGVDEVEGEDGGDVLEINGSAGDDAFDATPNAPFIPTILIHHFSVKVVTAGSIEVLRYNMLGGNDAFNGRQADFGTAIIVVVNGGDGSDEIVGGTSLLGGDGPDFLQGLQGADLVSGDAGDDTIVWNTPDGNDTVEGGSGSDELFFGATVLSETIGVEPNGPRVRLTSDIGAVSLSINGVETIHVRAGAGDDVVTGSEGLAAVGVQRLDLQGQEGDDVLGGGDTDDTLTGGPGDDTLLGGKGNDTMTGGDGINSLIGGPGDDLFNWLPGDVNAVIRGDEGFDLVSVAGLASVDDITVMQQSPTNRGLLVTRGTGERMALPSDVERLDILGLGGGDAIAIRSGLSGTEVRVDGGAGGDLITVHAGASAIVDGNTENDELIFDASSLPVSLAPSTISASGASVTHTQVEKITFRNLLGVPPTIDITSPTTDPATTASAPFVRLAGIATDADEIATITVVSDRGGSSAATASATTGMIAWTAANVPLVAGANVLTATVRDTFGNEASDFLTVTVDSFTYTMAEGATGAFFDTDILIANPNAVDAPVSITYLRGDGVTVVQALTLAPTSRTTVAVDRIAGLENTDVSATVTSTAALPLVVERTMRWDATGYGAHTDKATEGPATTWLFAEGAQGFFDTYVLLANPGPRENTATVTFLLENGAPVVKTFTLAPTSRRTVQANAIPEVVGQAFGIVVTFSEPGVAERAMYFGSPVFNAGHESAGVNAPATSWFLAEGATGSFFTTFVLLANPGTAEAVATVRFLPDTGAAVTKTMVVPAGQRVTLNIAAEDASLVSSAVATEVQSTQPILVERAQYWPFTPDRWHEAHNAFGSTAVGRKWGFAEGRVGGPDNAQTFILLANADVSEPAAVRITFLRVDGTTVVKSFAVNPSSRFNVVVNSLPELANESFGALIEVTSGPGIFAERALYSDAQGVTFAAGTNALATRLP